jgi:hypothetical protein
MSDQIACPQCGASFTETFTTQVGPARELQDKPESVTCLGEEKHKFPVLAVSRTSGGQRLYTLGDEIKPDA